MYVGRGAVLTSSKPVKNFCLCVNIPLTVTVMLAEVLNHLCSLVTEAKLHMFKSLIYIAAVLLYLTYIIEL